MNILIITDEVWNDTLYSNNVLTNWFNGLPVNIANLYLASGTPDNPCCNKYFQITDRMMINSFFTKKEAGRDISRGQDNPSNREESVNISGEENSIILDFLRDHPLEIFRLIKDVLWMKGKINTRNLENFIREFKPDIVFSLRMASLKVLKIEGLVRKLTKAPMVCFTGDDEYTLKQLRFSIIFWLRRILLHHELKESAKSYSKYYTLSAKQAQLYKRVFHLDTKVIMKCKNINEYYKTEEVNKPIRLIYAGRLYCNRYKTLNLIKEALIRINRNQIEMILDIYTKDKISRVKKNKIHDGINAVIHESVSTKKLEEIYKAGDIALHVESFDMKMRMLTRYSFSTKIVDCLASTCSVIAIGPKNNAGIQYLKDKNSAICITNPNTIEKTLRSILNNPKVIMKYQKRAYATVKKYHNPMVVQGDLIKDFEKVIRDHSALGKNYSR
ncbi:MAG: hypothetical protein ACK5JH_08840 [Anaerocolumna sp.]